MDASAGGDWVSREYLQSTFALRMKQLADDPTIPLFFGRLDYADDSATTGAVPHRPPPRQRPRGRPARHRLAGTGVAAVLPGDPHRADGRRPPAAVRVPARRADVVRGRGPHLVGPGVRLLGHPRAGDRAAARRPDARHRRHDPARAGRDRALRPVAVDLRAGCPGYGQDGGRPAPRGVPAVRAPRAADPAGRAGGRAERQLPQVHPRRAPRARRGGREAVDDRGARDRHPPGDQHEVVGARVGAGRRGDAQGRRPAGRGARPCAVVARDDADRGPGRAARGAAVARRGVRGRGAGPVPAVARGEVRRGAGDGAPGSGAPDPGADGARRRLPRRPRAERRRAEQAGQGLRRCGVAGGRAGAAGVAAALRPGVPRGLCRRTCCRRRSSRCCSGPSRRRARRRRRGRWPRRSWSTRPPTSSSAPARSATSSPTRRRTSRR